MLRPLKRPRSRRAASISEAVALLEIDYRDAGCSLRHEDPFELLVATILSAQCTDARVNQVTPTLFREFPGPSEIAKAPPGSLEDLIRPTGFFNAKARSMRAAAKAIVEKHGGKVPRTMDELLALPGVGRKTANVVLGNVWNLPGGVVVDTHVGRLARRLGWSRHADPEKVEADLNRLVPREKWVWISHALILHGRSVCRARRPLCESCRLDSICPKIGVAPARSAGNGRRG